jgi:radical SAM protein with 4Fe4S-binding SPASM domain
VILAPDIQVYVKTTATCNLDCFHCFTSGSKGAKVFFSPKNTADFLKKIARENNLNSVRLLYHGGEPMLAPLSDLYEFHKLTHQELPNVDYGIQTNLVYTLNQAKRDFFKEVIGYRGIGTSWDAGIRFGSARPERRDADEALWEKNVQTLVRDGHELTLMVSLSKSLVDNYEPKDIINYAISLGFSFILFERITSDGNATINDALPSNLKIDRWLYKMYTQTIEHKLYEKIGNMFLEEIMLAYRRNVHVANRCRGCEQKLITINADGTLAGCPNSATNENWGDVQSNVDQFLYSEKRVGAICAEKQRPAPCLTCEVNDICNGDCYKLKWDDDICSAPKTLFKMFKKNSPLDDCDKLRIN